LSRRALSAKKTEWEEAEFHARVQLWLVRLRNGLDELLTNHQIGSEQDSQALDAAFMEMAITGILVTTGVRDAEAEINRVFQSLVKSESYLDHWRNRLRRDDDSQTAAGPAKREEGVRVVGSQPRKGFRFQTGPYSSKGAEPGARERLRADVINDFWLGLVDAKLAAKILDIGVRHFNRLRQDFGEQGEKGLVHRLRGRHSNRALPLHIREDILRRAVRFPDWGPDGLSHYARSKHGVEVTAGTVRSWLVAEGLAKPRRRHDTK